MGLCLSLNKRTDDASTAVPSVVGDDLKAWLWKAALDDDNDDDVVSSVLSIFKERAVSHVNQLERLNAGDVDNLLALVRAPIKKRRFREMLRNAGAGVGGDDTARQRSYTNQDGAASASGDKGPLRATMADSKVPCHVIVPYQLPVAFKLRQLVDVRDGPGPTGGKWAVGMVTGIQPDSRPEVVLVSEDDGASKTYAQVRPSTKSLGLTVRAVRELHARIRADAAKAPFTPHPDHNMKGKAKSFAGTATQVLSGYTVNYWMKHNTSQKSYCEMLLSEGSSEVGTATVFVSWALSADVAELADAMEHYCEQHGLDAATTFFWLCTMGFDQNASGNVELLSKIVEAVGCTAFYMDSAGTPVALTRIWCLLEILATSQSGGTFNLAMTPSVEAELLKMLRDNYDFGRLLSDIDASKASAYKPKDTQMVTAQILQVTTMAKLSFMVNGKLGEAIANAGRAAIAKLTAAEQSQSSVTLNLAIFLKDQGDLAGAKALYEEVIDGRTQQLGAQHTDTLMAKMNLATLLQEQGDLAWAQALYEEVIEGYTQHLGPQRTDTLDAKMNLANLLSEQGDLAGAKALYEEVIEGYTQQLGPQQHTNTLIAKTNLAVLLSDQDDRVGAKALYEEVIEGYTQQLGAQHTNTLMAKMNLANLLKAQGDLAGAKALYEKVIEGYTQQLGAQHTNILLAKMNLANLLKVQSDLAGAKALYEEVIEGYTQQLGPHQTNTLIAKMNLASLLSEQGDLAGGKVLYEEGIEGFTQQLGAQHTETLTAKLNLAILLKAQGDLAGAKALYEEGIEGYTQQLGAQHTNTLMAKRLLAELI